MGEESLTRYEAPTVVRGPLLDGPPLTAMEEWAANRHLIVNSRYWISPSGRRSQWRKSLFSGIMAVFNRGIRLTWLYRRGLQNALDIRLVELEFAFPDLLQQFNGYRILHVSDTHLDVLPELAAAARELLGSLEVGMLALTGDIHGDHRVPISHSTKPLELALGGIRVRGHRIAVLGNHDPVAMADALVGMGFEVLVNRSFVLERQGERVRITGLDDVNSFYTEAAPAALNAHEGEFRIALVHSPEMADYAGESGYALYLCGHTHGSQVCLPGGRPIVT